MLERVRGDIAKYLYGLRNPRIFHTFEELKKEYPGSAEVVSEQANQILSIKIGNHPLKELIEMIDKGELVKVAEAQSLPGYTRSIFNQNPHDLLAKVRDDMLNKGFRRVEPLKPEGGKDEEI